MKTSAYLFFLSRARWPSGGKHFEPAEQYFHQALDIDPNSAMTLNYLGYMLADRGIRLPEALKFIRKAVEIDPMNGAYLDSLWVGPTSSSASMKRPGRESPPCGRARSGLTPPSTITWASSTRRQAAFAWPRRSGSCRSPAMQSPLRLTLSLAMWPKCSASWKAPASGWPNRTTLPASLSRNNSAAGVERSLQSQKE